MADLRDSCLNQVFKLAQSDPNIIFLTIDMDAHSLKQFREQLPHQYLNVGAAEQNAINVAAGLAMTGKTVYVLGICSFLATRCLEQIKINIGSMNLDVRLIGMGAGFSFAFDGCTHHGISDLGPMRSIPNLKIFSPSNSNMATWAVSQPGPSYTRLDKGDFDQEGHGRIALSDPTAEYYTYHETKQLVVTHGTGLAAAQAFLLEQRQWRTGKWNLLALNQLSPISFDIRTVINQYDSIHLIEEHQETGGLLDIIRSIARYGLHISYQGLRDDYYAHEFGSREYLTKLAKTS